MKRALLTATAGVALIAAGPAQQPLGDVTGFYCDVQATVAAVVGHPNYNAFLGIAIDRQGHYYVTARRDLTVPGAPHMLFELVAGPPCQVVGMYPQPPATGNSSWGLRDGATDYSTNTLYFGMEGMTVFAFDANAKAWDPSKDINVVGAPATVIRALTFDKNRNFGNGSFISATWGSQIFEFDMAGVTFNLWPSLSSGVYGAYTDRKTGAVWFWSQTGNMLGTSNPTSQVNGIQFDPVAGAMTGQEYHGDLAIAPGGGVAGGAAWNAAAPGNPATVVTQAGSDHFYEIWSRYEYNWGCGGDNSFSGGGAFLGNPSFQFDLWNSPARQAWLAIHLVPGSFFVPGLMQCALDLPVPLLIVIPGTPVGPGAFTVSVPIPPVVSPDFGMFTQWIEPDPTTFFPIRFSEAGVVNIPPGQ